MAARLIQRFSRLLAASPPFPASSSIPSEWFRACHPIQSPLPRPLHTSALCRYTDTLPALKEKVHINDEDFLAMIRSMTDPEELLQRSPKYANNCNRAAAVINQLAKVTVTNREEVVNDERFMNLLIAANSQIHLLWNMRLIGLLRDLYMLRVDENRFLLSVETEVRWRLKRFSVELLGRLARHIVPYAQTEQQKSLVLDLVKNMELRWTEVTDAHTVVNVIQNLSQVSKTLLERMEDKVLELAEFFTPEESRAVIVALAAQNCRSVPVLRALSFHLVHKKEELRPSVIVDLLYSYAKLNFSQHPVLQKMASDLLPKVPELSSKDMTNVIGSFAILKFVNLQFCEAVAQACLDHSRSMTPTQLSSVIRSFAILNFLPSQREEFFSMVVKRLSTELDSLSPAMLVDLVWSLCVLQLVTPAFLQEALNPNIYNQFMGNTSNKSSSYSLKLAQINATAQLECPEYGGPLLPQHLLSAVTQTAGDASLSSLQNDLRNVLKEVFPYEDAYNFNDNTVYGYLVDAKFVLDSQNNPIELNSEDVDVLHCKGKNDLPAGARRFVVKSWDFSDFCLRTKDLTGRSVLCRRHLQAAGFLVVEVPFYKWQELKSEWQKDAFLKDQIKKVVAERMLV